jgi:hypothetical protein
LFSKRKAGWTDLAFSLWAVAGVSLLFQSIYARSFAYTSPLMPNVQVSGFGLASLFCLIVALIRRIGSHPWRRRLVICALWFGVGIAGGLIQFETCCHTTWLQLAGTSIPLDGRGCGNLQPINTWWLRNPS